MSISPDQPAPGEACREHPSPRCWRKPHKPEDSRAICIQGQVAGRSSLRAWRPSSRSRPCSPNKRRSSSRQCGQNSVRREQRSRRKLTEKSPLLVIGLLLLSSGALQLLNVQRAPLGASKLLDLPPMPPGPQGSQRTRQSLLPPGDDFPSPRLPAGLLLEGHS